MALSIKTIFNNLPDVLEPNPKSLELFLNRADLIYTTISNDEKSKAFFLDGIKSLITENDKLAIGDLGTYELVRSVLISRIIPKKPVLQRFQDLFDICQIAEESIQSYSDRIRRAMYELNVTYKLRYKEDSSQQLDFLYLMNMRNSLDIFVIGIFNQNLRSLVIGKGFTNLEEAILYAEEKEVQLAIKPCTNHEAKQEQSVSSQTLNSNKISQNQKASHKVPLDKPIFKCGLCFRLGHQLNYCRFIKKTQSLTDLPINKNLKPIYECGKCFRKGHLLPFCRFINKPRVNHIHQSNHLRQDYTISPINAKTNLPLINYNAYIPPLKNVDNTFNQQSFLQPQANSNLPANPCRLNPEMHENLIQQIDTFNNIQKHANFLSSFNHTSNNPNYSREYLTRRSGY